MGSAALGLAYLATARLDGYYQLILQLWDVAAAALIVSEAGGKMTTPSGEGWSPRTGPIVASNGLVHDEFRKALRL